MRSFLRILPLLMLGLLGAACQSVAVVDTPAPVTDDPWIGEWVEFWPAETDPDIYRLVPDAAGSLHVIPLTQGPAQRIRRVKREGRMLTFVNTVTADSGEKKELRYHLMMEATGEALFGYVEFDDGSKKDIQWHKKRRRGDADALLRPQYEMQASEWAGEWAEDWPGSATHDRYRIKVDADEELYLKPLSNAGKQTVENQAFGANRLRFTLRFGKMSYDYLLVPVSPGVLNGRVELRGPATDGQTRVEFVQWRKVEP